MESFLPGTASLIDCVDKKLLVILRDGRNLIGILRSYDQFANLVLQDTLERIIVNDCYGEKERGIFIIRGENVVLLGEVDKDKEKDGYPTLNKVSYEKIKELHEQEIKDKKARELQKQKILLERGFSEEFGDYDLY
ncbi:Sm-like ribonucleoprotein [Neocallimastix lanati (nom. inval.)]|jgi:U6 snRNA-associated Sm-like protein LSm1|uniref:U6 snRNA-associated Sm-like protein LSm1 n=1 Tax=Neocallimastix californiae TaxID=1754190 RepID=A0A1Y2CJB9_9FUNG|nr:Sm-like ribonucleoprotein [Neocallimastix sp. JGI-2020a]ORY47118.1 U6 snRNA-associated Sm-like protein LSm1 [Neocallimastix californiae]|eukprot:ORY47118.1 U6 snRNA-associated Sm-like protein LSm1 [Neocallimastix californiae]